MKILTNFTWTQNLYHCISGSAQVWKCMQILDQSASISESSYLKNAEGLIAYTRDFSCFGSCILLVLLNIKYDFGYIYYE